MHQTPKRDKYSHSVLLTAPAKRRDSSKLLGGLNQTHLMTTLLCVWDLWARPQSHLHSVFQRVSKKKCCLFMLHLPWAQRSRIRWRASRRVSHRETDECVLLKPQSQAISAPHIKRSSQLVAAKDHFCSSMCKWVAGLAQRANRVPRLKSKLSGRKAGTTQLHVKERHCCNNEKGGRGQLHHLWSLVSPIKIERLWWDFKK